MKQILVTGGAGFIGSHLVDSLLEMEREVICLDNFDNFYDPQIKRGNIEPDLKKENFKLMEGDLRDRRFLRELFKKNRIAKIIHLAARAGVRTSLKNPVLYEEVNVGGTLNLLELAKKHGVEQFLFASSSSVYGVRTQIPFGEEEKLGILLSPYAVSKRGGELLSYTYSHLYGLPVTILRFFTVYGPRQRPEMAIHKFTRLIDEGREVPMFGNGTSRRDYTYISDIINGIISALEKKFSYEIFNLGNSHTLQLKELISLIEKSLGREAKVKEFPLQPGDVPITCADITKSKKLLNYDPRIDIEEGINRLVDWYKKKLC